MSFTYATAIDRLANCATPCFKAGITATQKLWQVNMVLERFYDKGTWRGVTDEISIVPVAGLITLTSAYQRLDNLRDYVSGEVIDIKPTSWLYSKSGPRIGPLTEYGYMVAVDQGDNASGLREYQLTGETAAIDAGTYKGNARKRYTWVTDTATVVVPDSFQALRMGVLALALEDENDSGYAAAFADALSVLNGNLGEFEVEEKQVTVEHTLGMGSLGLVH